MPLPTSEHLQPHINPLPLHPSTTSGPNPQLQFLHCACACARSHFAFFIAGWLGGWRGGWLFSPLSSTAKRLPLASLLPLCTTVHQFTPYPNPNITLVSGEVATRCAFPADPLKHTGSLLSMRACIRASRVCLWHQTYTNSTMIASLGHPTTLLHCQPLPPYLHQPFPRPRHLNSLRSFQSAQRRQPRRGETE